MGEAKLNPRSAQYAGPLPDHAITARSAVQFGPSEEWLKSIESTLADLPDDEKQKLLASCPPASMEVSVGVQALVIIPMATVPRAQWPAIGVGLGVMRIPFVELLKQAKDACADNPSLAALVKVPEETPAA